MGWGPSKPDMTASNIAAKSASDSAAGQQAIAQEQWNIQKEYLPKAMALADAAEARGNRMADLTEADSEFYRGVAKHQFERGQLSEKYQDQLFGLADEYSSGRKGLEEAGRANADVEQAYGSAQASMVRNASRYGINPGSGAFAGAMGDMYTQKALAGAGAQTNARLAARNKAEQLVAAAAGAGQQSFGNGLSAGGAVTSSMSGALGAGAYGAGQYNAASNTFNAGANGASAGYGGATNGYLGAASNFRNNAIESAKSPGFDFAAGLITAGVKGWAGSDRRLKEDIKRVGTTDDGIPIYTYRYKGGGPMLMGVMADEVEKVRPHAVAKKAVRGEFDAVNYAAL